MDWWRFLMLPLVIGLALGAACWIRRRGADLRGRRLPPMRFL